MFQWLANTDLDLQLNEHGIHQLMVIGLIAHSNALLSRFSQGWVFTQMASKLVLRMVANGWGKETRCQTFAQRLTASVR